MKKEEYKEGYAMGMISGDKDSDLLISPYPYTTDGTETYQTGYTNGYFMRYAQGLSTKLKANINSEIDEIIAVRLEEISDCMKIENKKTNTNINANTK